VCPAAQASHVVMPKVPLHTAVCPDAHQQSLPSAVVRKGSNMECTPVRREVEGLTRQLQSTPFFCAVFSPTFAVANDVQPSTLAFDDRGDDNVAASTTAHPPPPPPPDDAEPHGRTASSRASCPAAAPQVRAVSRRCGDLVSRPHDATVENTKELPPRNHSTPPRSHSRAHPLGSHSTPHPGATRELPPGLVIGF